MLPPRRRLLSSIALALLLTAVSVGAAGAASGPAGIPSHIALPLPHGGDVARYAQLEDGQQTDGRTLTVGSERLLADGQGEWHAAHILESASDKPAASSSFTSGGTTVTVTIPDLRADWLDAVTLERFAVERGGGAGSAAWGSSSLPLLGSSHEQASVHRITTLQPEAGCDLLPVLWRGLDLPGPVLVHGCFASTQPTSLRATGVEKVGDLEAIRLEGRVADGHGDHATMAVWIHPGLPFPLKYETRPDADDAKVLVSVLTGFQAGQEPWDSGVAVPAQPIPRAPLAPRQPWGASDEGVDHPFPLSQAWKASVADPNSSLHGFLASHPEAAACEASYEEQTRGEHIERTWTILAIADDRLMDWVQVKQTTEPVGYSAFEALGVPPGTPTRSTVATTDMTLDPHANCLRPAQMPVSLPSVAGAMAAWQLFTGSPKPANAWGESLQETGWGLSVGQVGLQLPSSSLLQPSSVDATQEFQELHFGEDGTAQWLDTVLSTYKAQKQGLPTTVPPAGHSTIPTRPTLAGIVPLPSLPQAAGLGFFSLLVAAAYYLWPVAKAGGLGLFSRLAEDDLLQHPVRRRLAALVEAQPGIHYQALVRASGAGQGATDHHLRKLVSARLLTKRPGTGFTCYFPRAFDPAAAAAAPVLKSDGARRILDAIRESPGASAKDVAATTGLDPATVTHHVQRLHAAGLVEAERVGRSLSLKATALGQAAS